MAVTFDISLQTLKRSFKERLSDLGQTSLIFGILQLILFIIFLVPILIFFAIVLIIDSITGKSKKQQIEKENPFLIDNPNLSITAIDNGNFKFYEKMTSLYGLASTDIDDLDDICFLQTEPPIDYFTNRLFTRTMTEFDGGVIMQEVNFDDWTSKLMFLKLASLETEILKELDFTYNLTFEKINERELKIIMRRPGDKKVLLLKEN